MNKKTIVASLAEIANELDNNNLHKEASDITKVMVKVAQKANANQVVYNVMKRMFGQKYNELENLNELITKNYQELSDAIKIEADKLGVPANDAIMRLNESSDNTRGIITPQRRTPMYKDRGVTGPSTFDPTQKEVEKYDPAAPDYNLNIRPMYDKAMQWINKNGGDGPSIAKKDAFDAMNKKEISPMLYKVIEEILNVRIMKTPARKAPTGPFRREK